jgi:hypothetical protein
VTKNPPCAMRLARHVPTCCDAQTAKLPDLVRVRLPPPSNKHPSYPSFTTRHVRVDSRIISIMAHSFIGTDRRPLQQGRKVSLHRKRRVFSALRRLTVYISPSNALARQRRPEYQRSQRERGGRSITRVPTGRMRTGTRRTQTKRD